jgi:uncharacterized membrane protein
LAIFAMIGANLAPHLLEEPYPYWFRFCSSLAAPCFILLAGAMVGESAVVHPRPVGHYLRRAAALLVVAALIDYGCWRVVPFTTFDVLYAVAAVLPTAHGALRLGRRASWLAAAAILGLTPLVQRTVGYGTDAAHPVLDSLQALFVDGWFPLFPWLGVGLLGAAVGRLRREKPVALVRRWLIAGGSSLFVVGIALWSVTRPVLRTRGGYAELFYPPTLGYLLVALGVVLWLLPAFGGIGNSRLAGILAVYGRTSLLMYAAHLVVIALVIKPAMDETAMPTFLATYFTLAAVLFFVARAVKRRWPAPQSFVARTLLGG